MVTSGHFQNLQETLDIHHGKHHQAYVTNLNKQIEGKDLDSKSLEEVPLSTSCKT